MTTIVIILLIVLMVKIYTYQKKKRRDRADNLIEMITESLEDSKIPLGTRLFYASEKCLSVKGLPAYVMHFVLRELRYIVEENK